jgi:hypothetical protein
MHARAGGEAAQHPSLLWVCRSMDAR